MRDATTSRREEAPCPGGPEPRGPDVVALDDRRALDPGLVGAKAAALARARRQRLPVLDGFVLTTDASLEVTTDTPDTATATSALAAPRPFATDGALYRHWSSQTHGGRLESVVRSSSTVEDGTHSSMAGRFESVLHVRGWEALVRAIVEVADSANRAGPDRAPMAVLVQPQADAALGGVLFGLDPLTGDDRRLLVSLVAGSPEEIVSGSVTGTTMTLSRRGRVVAVEGEVPPTFGRRERRALAGLARRARRTFGTAQDIEWLFEPDGTLRLLQSRPVTAAAVPARRGQVFGPGPVAETFPDQLSALERDLWLPPLDAGIAEALRISGAARRRLLQGREPGVLPGAAPTERDAPSIARPGRARRFVIDVDGRVAVDLEALGAQPRSHQRLRALDPRESLPRLRAAWRIGRLRAAFPGIIDDLVAEVDGHLADVGSPERLDDHELLAILSTTSSTLVGLHAHEVLAGLFLDEDTTSATGASVALATVARDRADGLADDEIVARHPVVLALTPPRIGAGPHLLPPAEPATAPDLGGGHGPTAPSAPAGGASDKAAVIALAIGREALRLRVRWVQELAVVAAEELGRRLARRGQLRRGDDVRHLPLATVRSMLDDPRAVAGPVRPPPERLALPAVFRLTPAGDVVADLRAGAGSARGVSPGRGRGPVVHDPPGADRAVLVVPTLDPKLADVLPRLAGLVSETGSPLSHLAILAREQHLPTVVGLQGATTQFEAGTVVTVDGDLGTVEPDLADASTRPGPPGGRPAGDPTGSATSTRSEP